MTPSTIFQWPLSPSGSFQPAKSLPLKSETKPAGASLSAAGALSAKEMTTKVAAGANQASRGMSYLLHPVHVRVDKTSATTAKAFREGTTSEVGMQRSSAP